MRAAYTSTLSLLLFLHFTQIPLQAQRYNWDATVNGGWSTWTHALSHHQIGFDNVSDLSLGSSAIGAAQLGYWITPYIGARLNFAYAESTLKQGPTLLFNNINQWAGTGDVLLRFTRPRSRWSGSEFLPFIGLGIGMQWINPAGDDFDGILNGSGIPLTCLGGICRGPITPGFSGIRTLASLAERTFFLKSTSTFSGLVSLGLDFRFVRKFAFRLEAGDRMWQAPIAEIAQTETTPRIIVEIDNSVGSTVHHLFITGGVSFLFGIHPPPTAYLALPAPPPPPPPEKPAPRPPTTESIKVCVIDPTISDGVRTIAAARDLRTGDTTVVRQGRRVPLTEITARVTVAGNTRWYQTGVPFVIGSGPYTLIFEPAGSVHTVLPADLSFIGTVDGLPVYIASAKVPKALENLGPTTDLARTVAQNANVRGALGVVEEILVPVSAAGCGFQSLVLKVTARKP